MKRFFTTTCIVFVAFLYLTAQESYYYCQERKIFLPENNLVRYVGFKNDLSADQAENLRRQLSEFCDRVGEYTPFFNKYFILEDKLNQFMKVIFDNDSLISLHTPNYTLNDTLTFYPSRTILVKIKSSASLLSILKETNIPYYKIVQNKYNNKEYSIHLNTDEAIKYSALLYETGLFDYSQPDFYGAVNLFGYENNPDFQDQWAIHNDLNMNLLPAWATSTGNPHIKVAVLDSGMDLNHPDLIDNLLEGYDAVDDQDYPSSVCCGEYETDVDFHGTCCAGIIGASDNDIGLVGISHTSKVIPIRRHHSVKVCYKDFPPNETTYHYVLRTAESWNINAFNHACYDDTADVISCSFSVTATDAIRNKVTEISQNGRNGKGCVVVVSSGNQEHTLPNPLIDTMSSFASLSCVIAVGGINECGERMRYGHYCEIDSGYNSCYGDSLDVVAPGIHVPTTMINGGYTDIFGGTSAAAPHVAGVAALVLSVNPCLTREEVKYVIGSTCTKIRPDIYTYSNDPNHPNGTWNIEVGYGLVNAGAAVALAQQMGGYTYVKDTLIATNTLWNTNTMINQNLTIDSLATLTVTDTLFVGFGSTIIVRPGGKLIVDGGTLTSACAGEMWQGIEVVGDRTQHQNAANQGTVILRNNATIENAHCAIKTGLAGGWT